MSTPATPAPQPLNIRAIFAGLMLGMLLAALSQTIVSPAMPRIVAELGGMDHYSWIAVSSLLASTVIVPIVGKLSDLFGRKPFYVGGIILFMAASVLAGLAPDFPTLIVARVVQGFGMGTMMPLSQAILGDIVAPRDRGKYQGLLGAAFGVASVAGPLAGGWITDHFTWRWLFLVNIPVALVALGFIIPFMHVPHVRRQHAIDYGGFITLTLALTTLLLAIVWGGTEYPWGSWQIIGLLGFGVAMLAVFISIERRVPEPVIPLRLWRNSIFSLSNIANMLVAMALFGAIYYVPVFVQGVIGASVTQSGAILVPESLSMIGMSIVTGLLISRTGRYKGFLLIGLLLMGSGFYLMTRMDASTTIGEVLRNIVIVGFGIGMALQTYTLIVQNAVKQADLGVATATTQLFRSIGATTGVALLGTVMTSSMARELQAHLPQMSESMGDAELNAGALLDPEVTASMPPEVLEAIRESLSAALHPVFVATLPLVALAFLATAFIREIPLRRTLQTEPAEAGKEILAEMNQAGATDHVPVLGQTDPAYRARSEFVGLVLELLAADRAPSGSKLGAILERIGAGDAELGRVRLGKVGCALRRDCTDGPEAATLVPPLPEAPDLAAAQEFERALSERPADMSERLRKLVEGNGEKGGLTPDDLASLERIALVVAAAHLVDRERAMTP